MGPEIKTGCAGEGQQEFILPEPIQSRFGRCLVQKNLFPLPGI
jgi:hypothetical protein